MTVISLALARVKKYLEARKAEPVCARMDTIHGIHLNSLQGKLSAADLQAMVEALEQPGRVLTKRQEDILKVFPIFWDNMFGGFIYAIREASAAIECDPKGARHVLEGLSGDLQNLREFMMYGEPEFMGAGPNWFRFVRNDNVRVIVQAADRVEAKLTFKEKFPEDNAGIDGEGRGQYQK